MNTRDYTAYVTDGYGRYYATYGSTSIRNTLINEQSKPRPEPPKTEEIVFKKPVKYFL